MVVSSSPGTIIIMAGCHGLSDPLRLAIVELLQKQELCVCELCDRLNVSQSKLSFHLKTLKEAKLIRARQSGRWIYYSLNLPQFIVIEQYLADLRRNATMNPASGCE